MSTRKHLDFHRKFAGLNQAERDDIEPSPLTRAASQLVDDFDSRKAAQLEEAEQRAALAGKGALINAQKRYEARSLSSEWTDDSVPAVTKFDAYSIVKDASYQAPTDRGIKTATYILYQAWTDDVDGSLTRRDLRELKARIASEHPKSALPSVVDGALSQVGFNTLKNLPRLARIASDITSQDDYNAAIRDNGLDGPENIRARAFIRALLEMDPEEVAPRKETMYDRISARLSSGDDPAFNLAGQLGEAPDLTSDGPGQGQESAVTDADVGMPPHNEAGESHVEIESPDSGAMLVLELGVAEEGMGREEPIDGMSPEQIAPASSGAPALPGGDMHKAEASKRGMAMNVDRLEFFGQLSEMMGPGVADGGMSDMGQGMPGEGVPSAPEPSSTAVVQDPTTGKDLEVTLRVIEEEPSMGGRPPMGDAGMAMTSAHEMCAEHKSPMTPEHRAEFHKMAPYASTHVAKSPPGKKKEVEEIKEHAKDEGYSQERAENIAFGTAWNQYKKEHKKSSTEMTQSTRSYQVYATVNGVTAEEPLDQFEAPSMRDALQRLASFGVDGQILADPANPSEGCLVVIDANAGDWLHVVAFEAPKINQQQPGQVKVPDDGAEALRSDGGFTQERAKRKPGKKAMSRDDVMRLANILGVDAVSVEASLLNGERVERNGWTLKVGAGDVVEFGKADSASIPRKASILDLDAVIADFQAAVVSDEPARTYHIAELFKARCAACKGVNEYVMPEAAAPLTCASCNHVASAESVAAAFERSAQLRSQPGEAMASAMHRDYLITVEIPWGRDERDFNINAKRIESEVRKVASDIEMNADADVRTAEIVVRNVDEPAVHRIARVLADVFGMSPHTAQYIGQTPAIQATPGVDDPSMNAPMQTMNTQPGAQQQQMQQQLNPLDPSRMGPGMGPGQGMGPKASTGMLPEDDHSESEVIREAARIEAQMMGAPGSAGSPQGMGGMGDEPAPPPPSVDTKMGPMFPIGGDVLDQEGKDAAHSALLHYRNQGMGVLDALAEFHREYSDYLDSFGDEASPERHLAEAEVVKCAGEVYSKPALIQRAAQMVEDAVMLYAHIFEDRRAFEAPKSNTQQPNAVPKQKLEKDTGGKEPGFGPPGKPKSQPGPMQGNYADPSLLPDQGDKEPGLGNPPKPSPTGQSGSQHKQPGTSYPNTDLGKDSGTGELPSTKKMIQVSKDAPNALRSK